VKCQEIQVLINGLTKQFDLSDGNKIVTSEEGSLLAKWRLQAEQLVFSIESLISQTAEAPSVKRWAFAGRIRMQYSILSEQPPPPLNFQAETQIKDKREEAIAAIVQLESVRDKTDDPTLRQELDRMSATFGGPTDFRYSLAGAARASGLEAFDKSTALSGSRH